MAIIWLLGPLVPRVSAGIYDNASEIIASQLYGSDWSVGGVKVFELNNAALLHASNDVETNHQWSSLKTKSWHSWWASIAVAVSRRQQSTKMAAKEMAAAADAAAAAVVAGGSNGLAAAMA